jgi:hypothetical protein
MLLVEWQSYCTRHWSGEVRYGCRNDRHRWDHCGGLCRGIAYQLGGNGNGVATSVSIAAHDPHDISPGEHLPQQFFAVINQQLAASRAESNWYLQHSGMGRS